MQGKFLQRKQDVSSAIVEHMAQQLKSESNVFYKYDWTGRTIEKHRSKIRRYLGFQIGTVADAQKVTAWLSEYILTREDRQFDSLKEVAYERYRELKIEPPQPQRLDRIIHSALRTADERFYAETLQKLTPDTREKLDALLMVSPVADDAATGTSVLHDLKSEAGVASLETVMTEIAKLARIRSHPITHMLHCSKVTD